MSPRFMPSTVQKKGRTVGERVETGVDVDRLAIPSRTVEARSPGTIKYGPV